MTGAGIPADPSLLVPAEPIGEVAQARTWRRALSTFAENKLAAVSLVVLVLIVLFCFVGPLVHHTDQVDTNILDANLAPGHGHLLGTDNVGYDILGRLMLGGQSSLEIGVAVAILATGFGAIYGAVAAWAGGIVDSLMMRVVDVVLSLPIVLVFVFLATVYRPTVLLLILVLTLLSWVGPGRLIRGEALSLRTREYVESALVMGGGSRRIVLRHILPNTLGTIIVNATFQVADAIIALALLGFLGFAVPPPAASWGGMLSNGTNFLLDGYWWEIYPAGIMILLTVVSINFIGDALRDSLDVRLQQR
jgi:peptide/nickel transport system permease protein